MDLLENFDRILINNELQFSVIETRCNYENEMERKKAHIQSIVEKYQNCLDNLYLIHLTGVLVDSETNRFRILKNNTFNFLKSFDKKIIIRNNYLLGVQVYQINSSEYFQKTLFGLYEGFYSYSFINFNPTSKFYIENFLKFNFNRNMVFKGIQYDFSKIKEFDVNDQKFMFTMGNEDFGGYYFLELKSDR